VAYPVRRERLVRLRRAMGVSPMRARTLGGHRFVAWRGWVLALREAGRAGPPLVLAPGMSGLWDKRFAAALPAAAEGPVTIRALGTEGLAALGRDAIDDDIPLPRLVYPALPAVWDEAGLAAVPHLGWRRTTANFVPRLAFRTTVSLLGAGFTVV
jgi:tRNA(Ile)-lysidine synthase